MVGAVNGSAAMAATSPATMSVAIVGGNHHGQFKGESDSTLKYYHLIMYANKAGTADHKCIDSDNAELLPIYLSENIT